MLILTFPRCLLSSPAPNLTWLQKCLLHPNQAGAGLLREALDGAAAHPVAPWFHVWELLNHSTSPLLPLPIQLFIGSHSHLKRFCWQNKSLLSSSRVFVPWISVSASGCCSSHSGISGAQNPDFPYSLTGPSWSLTSLTPDTAQL